MRTWTIKRVDIEHALELMIGPESAQIPAFDGDEAAARMLEHFGVELVPCCELEDDPCHVCAIEAAEKAAAQAEDAEEHRRELRREDDHSHKDATTEG